MGNGGGDISNCPDRAAWLELAAGLAHEPARTGLLQHAAECQSCALELKSALALLEDRADAAEDAVLHNLASSQPEWRKWNAASLARTARPPAAAPVMAPRHAAYRWVAAAAAIVLGVAAALWIWRESQPPMTLLARVYTEQRTFELRIPGAGYAPMRVTRGAAPAMPPDLLHSEAAIERHLQSSPNDVNWLRAEGRAALLEWRSSEAMTALRRVLDTEPQMSSRNRAETLTDLATANFERGEREGVNAPYIEAAELLTQAIAADPGFASAWFNRAIVRERLGRFQDALADWQHYLQLDSSGAWADDARRRMQELRQNIAHGLR